MWHRDGVAAYRELSSADRATFRKWFLAHAIIGVCSVVALIAIASFNKGGAADEAASAKPPVQQATAH
jgi:hypothetical protein